VSEQDTEQPIARDRFKHLHAKPISVSEAVERYKVPQQTIRQWITRKYIAVIKPGFGMKLDEQDVAYCTAIYHSRKEKLGTLVSTRLFDAGGQPYQLKYPDLSQRRRKRK
jgi:hypothetical protein